MKKLVIVESPTKARTLKSILGKDYIISASNGHVRDLPKKELGVDVENNFEPKYIVPPKAKKVITQLKKDAEVSDLVLLATDPDREGEAIAWHLKNLLLEKNKKLEFERVVFHELTKSAVEEAFKHPGKLSDDLVDAQQARRVLDRLVGYTLSPLLWKKVRYGLSAGRVQSVAVRLIVERERERDAFKAEEYWTIDGLFSPSEQDRSPGGELSALLIEKDGKKIEVKNEKQARGIEGELSDDTFKVGEIKKSERKRKPYAPFKTSTLQQSAANVLGFSARRTMSAAQKLFENGHITYHRTDSINLSTNFIGAARVFIEKEIGKQYLPNKGVIYKTKSKNAQEAHEAIRPTTLSSNGAKIGLGGDEAMLYSLIWKRALESQMLPAVYDQTSISIVGTRGYLFRASGSVIKFEGWLAIGRFMGLETDKEKLNELPDLHEDESMDLLNIRTEQHFTQPPARYSDATLIKALEEREIGRPSTYAPTITTILSRGYVSRETRYFKPEDVAYVVTDLLVEHFPNVIGYEFTAELEEDLDDIAGGKKEWVPVIREFFTPFEKSIVEKDETLNKADITKLAESEEKCPKCGKILNIKLGKYGKFLSCSGFPECEYATSLEEDKVFDDEGSEITDFGKCEKCEDGHYMIKTGKFGKFLACSNYPDCKSTKQYLEKIGMTCPECNEGDVIIKKAKRGQFFGCSNYPECKYASWKNPKDQIQE